eukprot:CAMPEP_0201550732 /NCGR_PEP_ID=MMETSP0173_2-20130828/7044_1 /ASSEMBLY_ACC=CAM_ASM_000268 /TAXON_ID=218659 /ORGANISM="Vexillifera sp., Strain DIVA3 564/2" /LENGTH=174 /DNA_ID=CAMNT_0047960797 /DNA_START=217 /DNA_END=741 /DNA_ORIENTATION=+
MTSPSSIKNDKRFSWNVTCPMGVCEPLYFRFKIDEETFRGSDREVEISISNQGQVCLGGLPCSFPMTVQFFKGSFSGSMKINETIPAQNTYKKDKDLSDTTYYVKVWPPTPAALDAQLIENWSGSMKLEWDEGTPTWVIVVFSVGGAVLLVLLLALGYCAYQQCNKKNEYHEIE